MKVNTIWHLSHPMPKNPKVEQRMHWHLEHVQHCACRGIPAKLLLEMKLRHIEIPQLTAETQDRHALDFGLLHSPDPKTKYGFAKELTTTAAKHPQTIYPHLPALLPLLDGDNQILKWTVIDIIGRLAAVDAEGIVRHQVPQLLRFLQLGELIGCNHAIFALGLIAQAMPDARESILRELLRVADVQFESEECQAIAIGKVVDVLQKFESEVLQSPQAQQFVLMACASKRNATAKRAMKLQKRLVNSK
jgi:hypothetical protein